MNLIAVLALAAADLNGQPLPDVVLLDFTASYCQPCQQMVPLLQRMERDGFPVRKVDITEQPQVSRQYKVDRIPTLILLVEGQEAERFVGLTAEAELRRQMNDAARKLDMSRRAAGAKEITNEATPDPAIAADFAAAESKAADVKVADAERPGLFDRMRQGLFGKSDKKDDLERPDFRAQSPDNGRRTSNNDSLPMQATVRVRLDDGEFRDVGTGTIVHSTAGQSTILTCAHIFKDVGADAAVIVEVFRDGEVLKYPGQVVGGDHNSDIAFLQIQTKSPLPMVNLAKQMPEPKAQVFSIGCNGGNLPTIVGTTVVELNRYEGPENVVCSIDPVQGRSGGGLFNAAGELIGVCSGAFRERKEGLYTAIGAVRQLTTQLKLNSLFEETPPAFADLEEKVEDAISEMKDSNPFGSEGDVFDQLFKEDGNELADSKSADTSGFGQPSPANGTAGKDLPDPFAPTGRMTTNAPAASSTEITVIIGSAENKKVVVIPRPSPWLLELLTGESTVGKPGLATVRSNEVSTTSARSNENQ